MSRHPRRRIAVVGSGIAGLAAAWRLSLSHEVTLFEAGPRPGGHANTACFVLEGESVDVDTGFIVYNTLNYPNFTAMLDLLGVETADSDMSFSASIDDGGFEYSSCPGGLFAQKRNLLRPRMWRMVADILRLQGHARGAPGCDDRRTLDDFLRSEGYSATFREDHILPMCAAIWSAPVEQMRHYPVRAFFDFFTNHGLLQLQNRPQWRTVSGGSRRYVERLLAAFRGELRLNARAAQIDRAGARPVLHLASGESQAFDEIVLACHSDQALALLTDADREEARLLGAIRYRTNTAVLHTDTRFMPRRRRAWASWNYLEGRGSQGKRDISLTYWMNRLQPLPTQTPVLVTLNPDRPPDPSRVIRTEAYEHPVFDHAAVGAQSDMPRIQGRGGVWYCGAWMGSGFHEDGLQAGLAVAEALGAPVRPWGLADMTARVPWPDRPEHRRSLPEACPMAAE